MLNLPFNKKKKKAQKERSVKCQTKNTWWNSNQVKWQQVEEHDLV